MEPKCDETPSNFVFKFNLHCYTEVVQIASVAGRTLTFTAPLKHSHFGAPEAATTSDGQAVEVRAEVGLLSHNVRIEARAYTRPLFSST